MVERSLPAGARRRAFFPQLWNTSFGLLPDKDTAWFGLGDGADALCEVEAKLPRKKRAEAVRMAETLVRMTAKIPAALKDKVMELEAAYILGTVMLCVPTARACDTRQRGGKS